MRNLLACVAKSSQSLAGTLVRQVFAKPDEVSAHRASRQVADEIRAKFPKAAALMGEAEEDVLAYFFFPAPHRVKLHSTNTLEQLNKEVKRRANVVSNFPMRRASCVWSARCSWSRTRTFTTRVVS